MKQEILNFIKECKTRKELEEIVDTYIDAYSLLAPDLNPIGNQYKTIGRVLDINPTRKINCFDNVPCVNNKWFGYIPNDIKIVYSTTKNNEGYYFNEGCYYYICGRDYLYDFAQLIKYENINGFSDFVNCLYAYMNYYFSNTFSLYSRDDISRLVLDKKGNYYYPSNEPDLDDFKYMGCAKCSEYSVMAQNILSLFGYDVLLVFDSQHAFNIFYDKGEAFILDFQTGIDVYNYKCDYIGQVPYIFKINNYSDELLNEFLYNHKRIELDDVDLYKFYNKMIPFNFGYKRFYQADSIKNNKTMIYLK